MKHYLGEYGTVITLDCGRDISDNTELKIQYQKPDGVTGEWTGDISGTNKIAYTLEEGDIDVAGVWKFQAYVKTASGAWNGETVELTFAQLFDETSFTDLQTVKNMIDQSVDDTSDDALLEKLIMQETGKIQEFTGRTLFYGTYTEQHDGRGAEEVFINNFPIDSITSVHDDIDRNFNSDTLIDPEYYYVDDEVGSISLTAFKFQNGKGNVKVVYSGGFKVIPDDLQLACSQLVVADYIELKGGVNVLEGDTFTYKPRNLRSEANKTIRRYKKMR